MLSNGLEQCTQPLVVNESGALCAESHRGKFFLKLVYKTVFEILGQ